MNLVVICMIRKKGEGYMPRKKIIAIILFVLLLACSFSVFADDSQNLAPINKNFRLYHLVNVSSDYHFEFWKPGASGTQLQEVSFDSAGDYIFATLMIIYSSRVNENKSLSVTFDRLEDSTGTLFYDYTMSVYNHNGDSITVVPNQTKGHGAGSVSLLSRLSFSTYSTTVLPYRDEIATFKISLDDTNALAGTYSGKVTVVIQNNN